MPTQLDEVVISFDNIKNNWGVTKNLLDVDFRNNIQEKINSPDGAYKDPANNYIKIHDYKVFLNIDPVTGVYNAGNLLDLSNIVHKDLPELETYINNLNQNNTATSNNNSNYENVKNAYDSNKENYITSKEKIHGALMQAKTQNENYNYLVSWGN